MMREREGFRAIPYAMEAALRALPAAQRAVLMSLAFEAQWEAGTVEVRGVSVTLDVGEALISYENLAHALRVSVSLVRRALKSGERIRLIATRGALPAGDTRRDIPGVTGRDTYRATPYGTPPTIVRFLRHREILWRPQKGDTPSDTPGDTGDGTGGDRRDGTIPQTTAHLAQITAHVGGLPRPPTTPSAATPAAHAGEEARIDWKTLDVDGSPFISNAILDDFATKLTPKQRRSFEVERNARREARRNARPQDIGSREWRAGRENRASTDADNRALLARWRPVLGTDALPEQRPSVAATRPPPFPTRPPPLRPAMVTDGDAPF